MFSNSDILLMAERSELYDNLATYGDKTGRLRAELRVFPSPQITWEFESLGETTLPKIKRGSQAPLQGQGFSIDLPRQRSSTRVYESLPICGVALAGSCSFARFGVTDDEFSSFMFLLPNAQFQQYNLLGQRRLVQELKEKGETSDRQLSSGSGGRFLEAPIGNGWVIRLTTKQDALEWLNPHSENVGTLLTTKGELFRQTSATGDHTEKFGIGDAEQILATLCRLLSFANGGHLSPLYIEGADYSSLPPRKAAKVLAYRTTPLQQLGGTWLTIESTLEEYVALVPTLQRMVVSEPWNELFDLTLEWYFQAIQPDSSLMHGKHWAVMANAVGAALERLSVGISKELCEKPAGSLHARVKSLLEKLGITEDRGFPVEEDLAALVAIRNNATHPIQKDKPDFVRVFEVMERAVQWVEETLLWRLGYDGKYRSRYSMHAPDSIAPRYDLSTRDTSW